MTALEDALGPQPWLSSAIARVQAEPGAVALLFPAVGRSVGRYPLPEAPGWTADDAARVVLLRALPLTGDALAREVEALYRFGDADEKRGVLRALDSLGVGGDCVDLLRDALRTNDTRLVAAALGPYSQYLDQAAWRHGVLKLVFMGVALAVVDGLAARADEELAAMLAGLVEERTAAGRTVPDDALALWESLTEGRRA